VFQVFHVFHFFHAFQVFQECMAPSKNETACRKTKRCSRPKPETIAFSKHREVWQNFPEPVFVPSADRRSNINMPQVFKCISCSAPLEFLGQMSQKCRFCGTTMIVPPEMFGGRPAAPSSAGSGGLTEEIRRLCSEGKKIEAIKVFRERTGAGLAESKAAVEAIERGGTIDLGEVIQRAVSGGPLIDPKAAKKAGVAVGAITIAVIAAAVLAIAGIAGAMFFLATPSDDNGEFTPTASHSQPRPARPGGEEAGMIELLRFGGEGTGAGRFKDNRVVAVDGNGRIYSSDYSPGRVQVFGPDGKFVASWPVGEDENVYDLAVSRAGRVYLVTNKGVTAFDGESGTRVANAPDRRYRGVAIGLDGRVYAAGRDGFDVFDKDLKPMASFNNAAKNASSSFGFEKVDVDGNGFVFMVERTTDDLVKFSSDGRFLNRIPTGLRSANDIALDPAGRIFLSDTSTIAVFSPEGLPLKKMKANQAFGITFDDTGMMYIASRPFVLKVDPGLE